MEVGFRLCTLVWNFLCYLLNHDHIIYISVSGRTMWTIMMVGYLRSEHTLSSQGACLSGAMYGEYGKRAQNWILKFGN